MTASMRLAFAACAVLVAAPSGPASAGPRKQPARYMVLSPDRPNATPVVRADVRPGGDTEAAIRWQDALRGENR